MTRTIALGLQDFHDLIEKKYFYIDKTLFIKEWWENGDSVTLITRPRRFGKTLNMSMLEYFFSNQHTCCKDIFQAFDIWKEKKYRHLQGTYPVINLSFARVKEINFENTRKKINEIIVSLYNQFIFLLKDDRLTLNDKRFFQSVTMDMDETTATSALYQLSAFLHLHYEKKVIILLDEYDTPMQEAYVNGYWEELMPFMRSLLNAAFKTNPHLERGMMTGITRISKESVFSDLNNLEVITTTSDKYATSFGFTQEEVFTALDEFQLSEEKSKVKLWYDGFIFGKKFDLYNPWSILNFLEKKSYETYWANTSSNTLISKLLQQSNRQVKASFESLLRGESISCPIDEQIIYNRLNDSEAAIFSLLIASGYLKVLEKEDMGLLPLGKRPRYVLALTNYEVRLMFLTMVQDWFEHTGSDYNDFVRALLVGNIKQMNAYMNAIALKTFSHFDIGGPASSSAPERFYHGFVLGLLAELCDRYILTSNRESGFGRYDVILEPLDKNKDAIILEFKVKDGDDDSLEAAVQAALQQIEEKQYASSLLARGFKESQIKKYGFAFEGKKVLIG